MQTKRHKTMKSNKNKQHTKKSNTKQQETKTQKHKPNTRINKIKKSKQQ